jgi:hypothetical protein
LNAQATIDTVKNVTYILSIAQSLDNRDGSAVLALKLIETIQEIYRFLEPSHYRGKLVVCTTFDETIILDSKDATALIDKSLLTTRTGGSVVVQLKGDSSLLLWETTIPPDLLAKKDFIFYCYESSSERFHVNGLDIPVRNETGCSSIYSLYYFRLAEELRRYSVERILNSSCEIFRTSWIDQRRLFFRAKPEEIMQKSLKEFLSSSMRGVDVVREYNLGASKPVDIRVYWKDANRAALIEVKWFGKSMNSDESLATSYSNARANDGSDQVKEYLDLVAQDSPSVIAKGYLVVIDGRRKGLKQDTRKIPEEDGYAYEHSEIEFAADKSFHLTIHNFENPVRMFARPICN